MSLILKTKSIYYSDVNILAKGPCLVKSRSEVPKELHRIIVSPMSAVIGEKFGLKAVELGLSLALHRFYSPEEAIDLYRKLRHKLPPDSAQKLFFSLGFNDLERLEKLKEYANPGELSVDILLDIANGYMYNEIEQNLGLINDNIEVENIMIGNIHTQEGAWELNKILDKIFPSLAPENKYIRVNVGGGKPCSTSDESGVNRGNISEIIECSENINCNAVADGGISKPGFASKAFGAGADYLMMGSYFSKAVEAETNVIGEYCYYGGASYKQAEKYSKLKKKHSEGKEIKIKPDDLKDLEILVDELWGGISSAVSYTGHKSLEKMIGSVTFEVKQNSIPPKNRS